MASLKSGALWSLLNPVSIGDLKTLSGAPRHARRDPALEAEDAAYAAAIRRGSTSKVAAMVPANDTGSERKAA